MGVGNLLTGSPRQGGFLLQACPPWFQGGQAIFGNVIIFV
jgi:hypothetical protein